MYIDVDTSIAVPVNVQPLIDDTDFKSREVSIAYNETGMDLVWNFVTTAGVQTQTAVTPTTAGDYDWTHVGDGMYKIEIPASGGVSINNDTEGTGWFTGICDGVLPWTGPRMTFRAAGLNDKLIDSAYDTTRGLAGTALPAAAADAAGGLAISDAGGLDLDTMNSNVSDILTDTAEIGAAGAGLTAIPWNAAWDAEVESECNDALVALKLDHLIAVADADDPVNNSIIAKLASSTGDWSTFVINTDSLEANAVALASVAVVTSNTNTQVGAAGAGLTDIGGFSTGALAEIQGECGTALSNIGLDHLVSASVTGTDITDNSIIAKLVSKEATADWDDYVNTTDSLQAIRDNQPTNFSSLVISAGGAADCLVQGFLNNTIAETTADNIAANFETFYDNADALTAQTVDDVGGGGGGGGTATVGNQEDILAILQARKGSDK